MVVMLDRPLVAGFHQIGAAWGPPIVETFEQGKTIFFPGDSAERVYFLLKGAVKLSRFHQAKGETTVALLRERALLTSGCKMYR